MTLAMLEGHSREIGGKLWTITLLPATKGLDVGRRLVKILGPAIGQAAGLAGEGGIMDADVSRLSGVLGSLAEHLGEPDTAALVKELATVNVQCDGEPVTVQNFDIVFAGDYGTLMALVAFVVETNFAGPLGFLRDAARKREEAARLKNAQPKPPLAG